MLLIDRIHKKWMLWCLKKCKGNKTHAADMFGICIRTWRDWEIKYKMRPKQTRRYGKWGRYDDK